MKKLEYAHKTSKLVVGRFYLVAHAHIFSYWTDNYWANVPIIPILHKDEDFAPTFPDHYHLDLRFGIPSYVRSYFKVENNRANTAVKLDDDGFIMKKIVFIKKKCLRLETGLKIPNTESARPFLNWYAGMKGQSCKGKICPHYKAVMNEINGQLVCPMHGLIGDIEKEIII